MSTQTRVRDWNRVVLNEEASLKSAIELMGSVSYKLCLVCSKDNILLGMVTDSDVRRSLLRGVSLSDPVELVMNSSPLVVSDDLGEAEVSQLMLLNGYLHMPTVDKSGLLTGLHVAKQLLSTEIRDEPFVIMAGGRGRRLMPLTENVPKPMLPIHGKPILEKIIDKAKIDGFRSFYISVNYLSHLITDYFGDGSDFGVSINYLKEDTPLGTAGALKLLPNDIISNGIVVTNSDIVTDVSYSELLDTAKLRQVDGLMTVRLQEWQNPFGVVKTDENKLVELEEKPTYRHQVNAGVYVLGKRLLELLREDTYCDMTDLFRTGLQTKLSLEVFPLHEACVDIGSAEDYKFAKLSAE